MSGTTFTPGPWRISGQGTIRAGDGWIGSVHWRNRAANAHLIAAAPDMYAALKALIEADANFGEDGFAARATAFTAAAVAIAKAEGQSP